MQVPFYRHGLKPHLADRVGEVIAGPFLTSGRHCAEVEGKLRDFFGLPHAKLTSSWTTGAIASLLALDIGPGDEVVVPAMTFVATANVVKLVGAVPVFVDVDPGTLLIDPLAVRQAVTPRTRAVIPVHLYGQMVDIPALREAVGPSVTIIEDAAHCFEGMRDGRRPGQDGDIAIFSFYATKNVTCGEGGAVIAHDPGFADRLSQTVLHGMSAGAARRFEGGSYKHWDVARLGTKANLPDLLAVLLGPQIDRIETLRDERERLARRYEDALAGTPFRWPADVPSGVSARHLFPVHVPEGGRDAALRILSENGVAATVNYRCVPDLTLYRDDPDLRGGACPVARHWGEGTLSLPLFPGLTQAEQEHVIRVLLEEVQPKLAPQRRVA